MSVKKEKLPNALTSEKELSSSRLVKNPKERGGRDIIDVEANQFFREFKEDIDDLEKADAFLQFLLRKKMVNLDETVGSAREKINERMMELEETQELLRRGPAKSPKTERDEMDEEFEELMIEEDDKADKELEYIEILYRVIGYLIRAGMVNDSDVFIKVQEVIGAQIKKVKSRLP